MTENEITTNKVESGDFPQTYIRFRSILDSLDLTAMRYFLKDKDAAGRIERAGELESSVGGSLKAP